MRVNPIAYKAVNDSIDRMNIASIRSVQTTERLKTSLDAIANLVVAASNYRASTKFKPPSNPHKSKHNKSIFHKDSR